MEYPFIVCLNSTSSLVGGKNFQLLAQLDFAAGDMSASLHTDTLKSEVSSSWSSIGKESSSVSDF